MVKKRLRNEVNPSFTILTLLRTLELTFSPVLVLELLSVSPRPCITGLVTISSKPEVCCAHVGR